MKQNIQKTLIGFALALCLLISAMANAQVGYIATVAGSDTAAYSGDGGPAVDAGLYYPQGVAVDTAGNLYIADWLNNRIRKVSALTGIITTIAGNGTAGYTNNGSAATTAELDYPTGVALDDTGNIYIADSWNQVIRKVEISTGKISTVVGNAYGYGGPYGGYSGDGGAATSAKLNNPMGVALDDSNNIYIADYYNNRIRKVSAATGIITTIAGNGFGADTTGGYSGDGGLADSAELFKPTGVAVDDSGDVYIADAQNNRIRKVTVSTHIINTIAGNGYGAPSSGGFSGDSGVATSAELYYPTGVALDALYNVYFTDRYNNRIRKVDASTHVISTIGGDGQYGFGGDGGEADSAQFAQPAGIAVDDSGNIYVADVQNNRIREISGELLCTPSAFIPAIYDSICTGGTATFTALITNGGPNPVYQWKLNGNNAGTDSSSYSYTNVHAGDKITCIITSNAICASPKTATSDTLKMGVYSNPVKPLISITASQNNVCSNTPITFSSAVLRGGINPVYRWKLNGDTIGGDSSSLNLTNLQTGSIISCILTSSLTCATPDTAISDTITMIMDSAVTPTISISASQDSICAGQLITFTSFPTNGGNGPIYLWSINGVNIPPDDSLFTPSTINNGDTVNVLLVSALGCVSSDSTVSGNIVVTVNPLPTTPIVTQSGDSLISSYANGNQWYFDSAAIIGATGQVYQPNQNGNYYAIVKDANGCVSANSDTINYIIQSIAELMNGAISIFPNPSNGQITLTLVGNGYAALKIFDAVGQEVYAQTLNESLQNQTLNLNISSTAKGVYVLRLNSTRGVINKQIVIQ